MILRAHIGEERISILQLGIALPTFGQDMKIYKVMWFSACNKVKEQDLLINTRNNWFKYTNNELISIPTCTEMLHFSDDVYSISCKCTFMCRILIKPKLNINNTKWHRIKHRKLFIAIEGLNAL